MTPEQFWNGDVWLTQDYYRARQLVIQTRSEEMWLQGLYNFAAVSTAVGNALRKKGDKVRNYPQKPFRLIPLTDEEKAALAQQERQKAVDYFSSLQARWERAKCRSAKSRSVKGRKGAST